MYVTDARLIGCAAARVTHDPRALQRAIAHEGPALVEVLTDAALL